MITKEMIDRINFLYHKSQTEGLTEEEKEEQKRLRQEYVKEIRERLKESWIVLNMLKIVATIVDMTIITIITTTDIKDKGEMKNV
nr:DUF896 domain-containing protein [Thermoanaerobacter indiensis]